MKGRTRKQLMSIKMLDYKTVSNKRKNKNRRTNIEKKTTFNAILIGAGQYDNNIEIVIFHNALF